MNATEKTRLRNWMLAIKWLNLAIPILLICALVARWLLVLAGIPTADHGIVNSFVGRLSISPDSYWPILLAMLTLTAIAIWPGKHRPLRTLIATFMLWGLGLAVSWGFDGGLGTVLLSAGTGILNFGAMDFGLQKLAPQGG